MIAPLLTTKFNKPPPRPELVPRERLIERLNQGTASKLILICAPAGFGKTTIMSLWGLHNDLPSAWLSLDVEDNQLTRFFVYMITALQAISPEVGQASLAMLQSTQSSPPEAVLTVLINELSSLRDDYFLFLDDYHLIEAQAIHSALTYLVDHLPQQMHIVIASRSDPPLPLSRLRARGQLMELRQADLRFTPEEAAGFLKQSLGLQLTSQQVSALEARTEGWIAGLQLAALSMRGKEDLETFIRDFSGSHRFVIDYLADEVFSQQTEEVRQFLLETSILDRLTPSLCQEVTGRSDSAALLRMLEEANLFLIPLDDQRAWYRYHPLFQDFLRTRLEQHSRTELHRKASQWFLSNGYVYEAVNHALTTGNTDLAEQVISQAVMEAFKQAAFPSLLGWLEALPEERVLASPVLAIYKSLTLFITHSLEEALPYGLAAEKLIRLDTQSPLQGQLLCLKAHLAMCVGQLDECVQYARDALEYLEAEHHFLHNLTLNVLGQVLEMKEDVPAACDVYRQAFEAGWQAGDHLGALVVFTNLMFGLNELGRRREAVAWCQRLVADEKLPAEHGLPLKDAIYLPWSLLEFEANNLDLAFEYSERTLKLAQVVNFVPAIILGQYLLALVYLARGQFEAMHELTRQGREFASQTGRETLQGTWFAALEAQASLERGDVSRAVRWADSMGYTPQDSPNHWMDQPYFTYLRSLLMSGQVEAAQTLLNTMETLAERGGRQRKLITIHLLQAQAWQAQGKMELAFEKLSRSVEIAAPEGYRRAFLDEGQAIQQLLAHARPIAPAFVDELLFAQHQPEAAPAQNQGLMEALTEREQEVLELVAMGLSNREIADKLFVTLGTTKKHLNNIFSKLYVESRTQAIARARELGLLK
ncbi:MAG TPA: LuxR C-terminal-related transcriptional regulator [Anaerolineales bacterium]|nr:LuxR C-terminal-related transcriptional regulator [Anaerolineales bacterium]